MSNKENRKELELLLVKTIEEVLNKKNSEAGKKIRKTTYDASKSIAKKFYRAIPSEKKVAAKKKTVVKKSKETKKGIEKSTTVVKPKMTSIQKKK